MAIGFGRAQPIQRSKGHSAIKRLAYLARQKLVSARTGQVFDFSDRRDLIAITTLSPPGCPGANDPSALWQAMEAASNRVDAVLGFELLLSLPMPSEFPIQRSLKMAEDFVRKVIVEKHGLAATLAVHGPHGSIDKGEDQDEASGGDDSFARGIEMASANAHAHILVSPRQVTPAGPGRRRYTVLDPITRNRKTYGRNWGRLWRHFQNRYFASVGSDLRVTANPPTALTPVPLKDVRRWRKRRRRAEPHLDGRKLLVNAEREHANRTIVETIHGALECFDEPFTAGELGHFYRRHLPEEIAIELTGATIGLGDCVGLGAPGSAPLWYAGIAQIHHELAGFGRALMLCTRVETARDVSDLVAQGYSGATCDLLTRLFAGPDLVMVNASTEAGLLAADIARIGEAAGLVPVTIANAAGHAAPTSVVLDVRALRERMVSRAVMIIDDADALNPRELSLILAAGIAGMNKVVLIRRNSTDWPRLELLDLIAHHAPVLDWPGTPDWSAIDLWNRGAIAQALEKLDHDGAIGWFDSSQAVMGAVEDESRVSADQGVPLLVRAPKPLVNVAADVAPHPDGDVQPMRPQGDFVAKSTIFIPITNETIGNGNLLAVPLSGEHIRLLVARDIAATRSDLCDLLSLARPLRSAITNPAARCGLGRTSPGWPRFAVDPEGDVVTTRSAVARTVRLLSTFTLELDWTSPGYLPEADHARLDAQLDQWLNGEEHVTQDGDLHAPTNVADFDIAESDLVENDDFDSDWPEQDDFDPDADAGEDWDEALESDAYDQR